jgi:hypothetical protein
MNNYTAVGIAEGFIEAESDDQVIEAWKYLPTLAWRTSWRMAQQMLADGVIW